MSDVAHDRYRVSVDQYVRFRRDGFLVVRGLVPAGDVAELRRHTEELMEGRLPEQQQDLVTAHGHTLKVPEGLTPEERATHFLRIHMLHRLLPLHERYLLHPRVLDVMEVLIGPDVLALQTMLFIKGPGQPGQGWHQDSYYIPTHPDTLCGAWIAIDDCDERNGAMWFAKGSGVEPVYPPCPDVDYGFGDKLVGDIKHVRNVSDTDDARNGLSEVADRYDQVLVEARAGDVVFFGGHILHRSKTNWTADRFRRAFVSHYCNARSMTQWGGETGADGKVIMDWASGMANMNHILARGETHLPFARPRFGTPCAALLPAEERRAASDHVMRVIASMNNGLLGCAIADPNVNHDHDEGKKGSAGGY